MLLDQGAEVVVAQQSAAIGEVAVLNPGIDE
jgi:hypothetical protein